MPVEDSAFNRRDVLRAASCLTAAPFMTGFMAWPAEAGAPMLGASLPTHYRFKLGGFEITSIADGAVQREGPFPLFGANKTAEEVQALMEQNLLPKTRLEICFTPLIVNTGKEVVLFDAGNAPGRPGAGLFLTNLAAAGFKPEQIDLVVITHCHGDHIGGLMTNGAPSFPNARYVMNNQEHKFWTAPETLSGPAGQNAQLVQKNVLPLMEKMSFIEPGKEIVSGITAIEAYGHTPGHMAFHIESEGKRLLNWVDCAHNSVISLQRPDWHLQFDIDKDKAAETRKRIYDMATTERIPVAGYHMPFPAFGFVEKKDSGYRWVQATYQFNL